MPISGRFVDVNENAGRLFGLDREQLLRVGPAELSPPLQPDGSASRDQVRLKIERALDAGPISFEWLHRDVFGKEFMCDVRLLRLPSGSRRLVRGSLTDISERKRQETSAAAEHAVFEKLTRQRAAFGGARIHHPTSSRTGASVPFALPVSVLAPEGVAFQYTVSPRLPEALASGAVHGRGRYPQRFVYCRRIPRRQVLAHDIAEGPVLGAEAGGRARSDAAIRRWRCRA